MPEAIAINCAAADLDPDFEASLAKGDCRLYSTCAAAMTCYRILGIMQKQCSLCQVAQEGCTVSMASGGSTVSMACEGCTVSMACEGCTVSMACKGCTVRVACSGVQLVWRQWCNACMCACHHSVRGPCLVSKCLLGNRFCVLSSISSCAVFEAGDKCTQLDTLQIQRLVGILAYASNAGWG